LQALAVTQVRASARPTRAAEFRHAKENTMKLGALLGIAAIGGFAFAHKRRGGDLTLASMKETARSLFGTVRTMMQPGTNSSTMYDGDGAELRH
jgi:hypothetical protein